MKKNFYFILFITFTLTTCSYNLKNDNIDVIQLGIFSPGRLNSVAGQDGCTPIKISDQYYVWTFGDTILGEWKEPVSLASTFEAGALFKGMLSNSIARTPHPDSSTISDLPFEYYKKNRSVIPVIPDTAKTGGATEKHWPVGGTAFSGYLFLYIHSVSLINAAKLELKINGTLLSKIDYSSVSGSEFKPRIVSTKKLFTENEPVFGDSVLRKNGNLIITGRGVDENGAHTYAYIAQCPEKSIEQRDAYSFYAGGKVYSRNINDAEPFFHDVVGEYSLTWNQNLKKYIASYCDRNGSIRLKIINSIDDPDDSMLLTVYTPEKLTITGRPFVFYYSAKEIYSDSRSIYIIYMNPKTYQPMLLKIPLSHIEKYYDKKS